MKSYKEFKRQHIGSSDIARLIIDTPDKVQWIDFGEDGEYSAYIVDDSAEIGEHYTQIFSACGWAHIFDDFGRTASFNAQQINIYRAGSFGCIIQLIDEEE